MQSDKKVQVNTENSLIINQTDLNVKRLLSSNDPYFLQSSVSIQNKSSLYKNFLYNLSSFQSIKEISYQSIILFLQKRQKSSFIISFRKQSSQYHKKVGYQSLQIIQCMIIQQVKFLVIQNSNHKSAYSDKKNDESSLVNNTSQNLNESQQNSIAQDKQYMNFPQLETKKSLQILSQQLQIKKGDIHLNDSQSLPKLKLSQDFQNQNSLIGIPNHKKKISSTDWSINESSQYQLKENKHINQNIPKILKPLEYRPKIKLVEYMLTEPKENNEKQQNVYSDKFKSLLQLRQSIHYTSQQSQNQSQNMSPILRIQKEKQPIPYLSSQIEKQQKEQQFYQQSTIKKNNVSLDRRFKFSCKTKAGCTYDKQTKTNQDSPIIYPKQLGEIGISLFAVCDGHGKNGHLISGYIRKNLPKCILKNIKKDQNEIEVKQSANENEKNKDIDKQNKGVLEENQIQISELINNIKQGFNSVNQEILKGEHDSNLSGSTLVSVFIVGNTLICANVGDSRAVLAKSKLGSEFKAFPLSIDHKPSLEREKQRIISSGGRVSSQKDNLGNPIGPLRVWMNTVDIPGLAMTRSFGDKVGMQAGVNCEPEIIEAELTDEDKFIIIASDGVWEHISSQDAIRIVEPFYEKGTVEQASERLVIEASNAWKKQSLSRDDITCIVIFIQNPQIKLEDSKKNNMNRNNNNIAQNTINNLKTN